jgi:hypothetical protein
VIFDISGTGLTANELSARLAEQGILASGFGSAIRMVTHYDVSSQDIDLALAALRGVLKRASHA